MLDIQMTTPPLVFNQFQTKLHGKYGDQGGGGDTGYSSGDLPKLKVCGTLPISQYIFILGTQTIIEAAVPSVLFVLLLALGILYWR